MDRRTNASHPNWDTCPPKLGDAPLSISAVDELLASVSDRELVYNFVCLFAGMEYALKRSGWLKPPKRPGDEVRADADWRKFTDESLKDALATGTPRQVVEAVKLLQKKGGPKEQYRTKEGYLDWRTVAGKPTDSDEWRMIRLVKTVRNNLFHGGKYGNQALIGEPAKDVHLLRACSTILKWCIERDEKLAEQIKEWVDKAP